MPALPRLSQPDRPTASRPVWLLDVDGTLSPLPANPRPGRPHPAPSTPAWQQWSTRTVTGMRIDIADEVLTFVRRVHREGLVDIRWASTWGPFTADIAAAFDLPDWPWTELAAAGKAGKRDAAHTIAHDEQRPLIWTDDHLDRRWVRDWPDTLAIRPRSTVGLAPDHLAAIDSFLAGRHSTPARWPDRPTLR